MNFLAHLALSGNNSDVMLGNFIGDYVKGDGFESYRPMVRTGIKLHRHIDSFTDQHPSTKACAQLLYPTYGRYAGVITDMFYDHFLSVFWSQYYPETPLEKFVSHTHRILILNYFNLPGGVKKLLPFLIKSKRLLSYGEIKGLHRALDIMARNTSLPDVNSRGIEVLHDNYETFAAHFREFYPEIQQECHNFLNQ